jgi:hypothetical protein
MRRFYRSKMQIEFASKNFYFFLLSTIFLISAFWLIDLFVYAGQLLSSWQLLEPAENENLVLTWAIKNGHDKSIDTLLSHGILPIYPDFYHRLSAFLPLEPQTSGRLLSLFAYFSTCMGVYFLAKKRTRSWVLSFLFVIILFGTKNHAVYFLMQRPDSLYVSLGFLSLIFTWWNLNAEVKLADWVENLELWRCLLSGLLLGLAVLSKQTALIFAVVQLIPFIIYIKIYKRLNFLKPVLIIGTVSALTIIFYFAVINNVVFYEYQIGYDLFGKSDLYQLYRSFSNYYYPLTHNGYYFYFLAFIIAIFNYKSREYYPHHLLALASLGAVSIVTIKMWGNTAAVSNNFIFISLFGVLFSLYFWPKDNSNLRKFLVILPLFIFSISASQYQYMNPQLKIFSKELKSIFKGTLYLSELTNSFKANSVKDPILDYVLKNPGNYITTRLDNYLIYSNRGIELEGSVLGQFVYMDFTPSLIQNEDIRARVRRISNEVREKINSQYYDGIILGIQPEAFKKNFPELSNNYTESIKVPIRQGVFEFDAVLYLRKI